MSHRIPWVAAVAATAVLACAPAEQTADVEAVRTALDEQMAALRTQLLAGDVDGFMAFWTDDVRVLEPGLDAKGTAAFREYVAGVFGQASVTSFTYERLDLWVHGNVAYDIGEYDETIEFEGQATMNVENRYVARWERGDDGVWRINRLVTGPREAPEGM